MLMLEKTLMLEKSIKSSNMLSIPRNHLSYLQLDGSFTEFLGRITSMNFCSCSENLQPRLHFPSHPYVMQESRYREPNIMVTVIPWIIHPLLKSHPELIRQTKTKTRWKGPFSCMQTTSIHIISNLRSQKSTHWIPQIKSLLQYNLWDMHNDN